MLVVSAAIREKAPPGECRNWARAMGAVGVGLVSLQTIHATLIAEKLNTELMVKQQQKASEIAKERVLAVTSKNGHRIEFGVSKHGLRIGTTDGRYCDGSVTSGERTESNRRGQSAAIGLCRDGRTDAVNDGFDVATKLPQWWRNVWNATDDGSDVSFRASGEIEGESF
jgi:hypothetical protein